MPNGEVAALVLAAKEIASRLEHADNCDWRELKPCDCGLDPFRKAIAEADQASKEAS